MGVSLHSKIHPLFMYHSNGSVMHTSIRACFVRFFYNPYISLLIYLLIYGAYVVSGPQTVSPSSTIINDYRGFHRTAHIRRKVVCGSYTGAYDSSE